MADAQLRDYRREFDAGTITVDLANATFAEAVTSYFGAVGIRASIRPMERGAFFKEYGDKRLKHIIQSTSAAFGTAATRIDAFVAAGGFEANLDWLRDAWGDAARNFIVRGTPYNTGTMLRALLDAGAAPVGSPRECHAVAIDGRAPKFDGGIVTRLDCVPLGIVVDRGAERFYDEGEDAWPKRYAIWGKLVARRLKVEQRRLLLAAVAADHFGNRQQGQWHDRLRGVLDAGTEQGTLGWPVPKHLQDGFYLQPIVVVPVAFGLHWCPRHETAPRS